MPVFRSWVLPGSFKFVLLAEYGVRDNLLVLRAKSKQKYSISVAIPDPFFADGPSRERNLFRPLQSITKNNDLVIFVDVR